MLIQFKRRLNTVPNVKEVKVYSTKKRDRIWNGIHEYWRYKSGCQRGSVIYEKDNVLSFKKVRDR